MILSKDSDNKEISSVRLSLEEVLEGLKYKLIELTVSKQKGSVQIRVVIYNGLNIGTDDCSKVHRAISPRLELAYPGQDIYLEVSSPGINRLIKDGFEFSYYIGRAVRCYCTDITEWTSGVLESADEKGIVIKTKDGTVALPFENIAKAKLETNQNDL